MTKQIEFEILKPQMSSEDIAIRCDQFIAFTIQEIQKIPKISDRYAVSFPLIGAIGLMNLMGVLSDSEHKRIHLIVDQLNGKELKS